MRRTGRPRHENKPQADGGGSRGAAIRSEHARARETEGRRPIVFVPDRLLTIRLHRYEFFEKEQSRK